MKDVLIVFAVLVATGLGVLYLRYRASPAARWKRRVRAAVRDQEHHVRAARRELAAATDAAGARALREEYLDRQLGGTSVEALADYPGIGPVTVGRLREAGLATIGECGRARLASISGIGPSRQKDLKVALRKIRQDAEARFNAGASREAAAYAEELNRRQAGQAQQIGKASQAVRTAEAGLVYLVEPARIAAAVTFLGYLFRRPVPGLTDELLQRPLQDNLPSPPPSVGEGLGVIGVAAAPVAPPRDLHQPPSPGGGQTEEKAEPTSLDRLRAAAAFGLVVARADSRIAAAERRQVQSFLRRRYAPTAALADQVDAVLTDVGNDLPTLGDVLWRVRRTIPADEWPDLYQFAQSVADASGGRNAREVECLARIAEELGMGPSQTATAPPPESPVADSGPDDPPSELQCRADLEIESGTPLSVDLVRRQYRLLSERFAEAKFASHGPEFAQMAADKRARIERAARHLVAEYNEPLEPPDASPPPADPRHNPDLDAVFGA
jgi:uncharacterized tellurite resistance protein B-like protein